MSLFCIPKTGFSILTVFTLPKYSFIKNSYFLFAPLRLANQKSVIRKKRYRKGSSFPPQVVPVATALVQVQGFVMDTVDCHGINLMV